MAILAALLLPGRALAESGDGFRLDSSGKVVLDSDHAAKEGISSLCFSLTVEAGPGATVAFEFSGSNARVTEAFYDANSKKMNIYMAGTEPLFANETESLDIGRVVVQGSNGGEGSALVGVAENSLQYVYGSRAKTMEGVSNPNAVQLGTPASTQTPPDPAQTPLPDPTQTPPPENTQTPGGSTGGDGNNSWQPSAGGSQSAGGSTQTPAGGNQPVIVAKKPVSSAPTSTVTPSPERTPRPSPSPSPSPAPTEGVEQDPPDESGAGDWDQEAMAPVEDMEVQKGAGFWESVKPVLIGFLVAALASGGGAAVVLYLIKGPKRR